MENYDNATPNSKFYTKSPLLVSMVLFYRLLHVEVLVLLHFSDTDGGTLFVDSRRTRILEGCYIHTIVKGDCLVT